MNPLMLGVLVKFRKHPVAFTADIEKAFLQIRLANEDRDVTRFLWLEGRPDEKYFKLIVLRMTRVLFGVTSSPFLLAATIKSHIKKYETKYPEACKLLNECLYVDDLIGGGQDIECAYKLSTDAEEILNQAKMPLRKWQTNSESLRQLWKRKFSYENHANQVKVDFQQLPSPLKILGLSWVPEIDMFKFDVTSLIEFLKGNENTKRFVLKASSRIFDPLGFLSPFTIRVKCLYQELWQEDLGWDERLPNVLALKWANWCSELQELSNLSIPRWYQTDLKKEGTVTHLHCFCDASEKAYGAVVYIRTEFNGHISVTLVAAKTRVAPLKKSFSIPRLELMAALVGARLVTKLLVHFEEYKPFLNLWTDSIITYHRIQKAPQDYGPFVANRIKEIQELIEPEKWRHISGHDNPADLLSRGMKISDLIKSEKWWKGPKFLQREELEWPKTQEPISYFEDDELKSNRKTLIQASQNAQKPLDPLLDISKFSRLLRLLRVTIWILRFVNNLKNKGYPEKGPLTTEEFEAAENYWVKIAQATTFSDEIESLKSELPLGESKIKILNPFIDAEGLLRVGGRLTDSELGYSKRHPIILPENNIFTKLQIISCHEKVFHLGVASTLTQIREKYWIGRGRQIVKGIISKCLICRRLKAMPSTQVMAPLPRERIVEAPPFQVTGLDFMGPFFRQE